MSTPGGRGEVARQPGPNRLLLMGWLAPDVASQWLARIEQSCARRGVLFPAAYESFCRYRQSPDCLWFHHSYAERDIPMGQRYTRLARANGYQVLPGTVQPCRAEVLFFATNTPQPQPSDMAMRGHHEFSFIRFEDGVPDMVTETLYQITALPFNPPNDRLCLF